MDDRPPMSQQERTRADLLGWATAIVVIGKLGRCGFSAIPRELKDESQVASKIFSLRREGVRDTTML